MNCFSVDYREIIAALDVHFRTVDLVHSLGHSSFLDVDNTSSDGLANSHLASPQTEIFLHRLVNRETAFAVLAILRECIFVSLTVVRVPFENEFQ